MNKTYELNKNPSLLNTVCQRFKSKIVILKRIGVVLSFFLRSIDALIA